MNEEAARELLDEAQQMLDLIQAEWESDPMSVMCFDVRLRNRVENWLTDFTMTNGGRIRRQ